MSLMGLRYSEAGPYPPLPRQVRPWIIRLRRRLALMMADLNPWLEGDQVQQLRRVVELVEMMEKEPNGFRRDPRRRDLYIEYLQECLLNGISEEWILRVW